MSKILILAFLVLLFCGSRTQRFPSSISPTSYDLTIELLDQNNSTFKPKYDGQVIINFQLRKNQENLQINSVKTTIFKEVELKSSSKTLPMIRKDHAVTNQITTIWFGQDLPIQNYSLTVRFSGYLSDDGRGFFHDREWISFNGSTAPPFAATSFEPHRARRAFPCFDEPALRATFTLTLVHPKEYTSWSNTPAVRTEVLNNKLAKTTFETTPKMSTYNLAFMISRFTCDSVSGSPEYKVCSPSSTREGRKFALELAPKAIKYMGDYTGIPYKSLGIRKLDMVAVPGLRDTAAEYWGLIMYGSSRLLMNPGQSDKRSAIGEIVVHEVAHMWFGNYVTCRWWSDLFLKEGFATYFHYFALAAIFKDWQYDKMFVLDMTHLLLSYDTVDKNRSLIRHVHHIEDYVYSNDPIPYGKAACILHMISHVMGTKQFRLALQNFLNQHKHGSAVSDDLVRSLSSFAPKSFFGAFVKSWFEQISHPNIDVELKGNDIIIKQERAQVVHPHIVHYVTRGPLCQDYPKSVANSEANASGSEKHNQRRERLDHRQQPTNRVNYDWNLLKRISGVWAKTSIHDLNRAQIVDDLFNFAKDSTITYSKLFDIIGFLSEDTNFFSWFPAFEGFGIIMLDLLENPRLYNRTAEFVSKLMSKLYHQAALSTPDDYISTRRKNTAVEWACRLGIKDCIDSARTSLMRFKQDNIIDPNFLFTINCTLLGNDKLEDWKFLQSRYNELETTNPFSAFSVLKGLACNRNKQILEKFLNFIVTKKFESNTVLNLFSTVISHGEGAKATFKFITKNFEKFVNMCHDIVCSTKLLDLAAALFKTESQIEEFKREAKKQNLSEAVKTYLKTLIEKASANVHMFRRLESELDDYFAPSPSTESREPSSRAKSPSVLVLLAYICLLIVFDIIA